MINNNNEFYQNSMINARKDNDEWKNAAGTCFPNLIEKSINENGDYSAKTDGVDGYSKVTVDVAGGGGETFAVNLTLSVKDQETFDVSSSEAFNDIISAIDNGDKLNLVITVDWGDVSETLSYVMYYKLTKGSTIALLVFGSTEYQSGWCFIQWLGNATTANFREVGMLSVDIIGE